MKLLALPSCNRLNQILAGMPCQYRFNEVDLETINAYFQGKGGSSNCGTLLIDEIKLRQSVVFNPSTYKFDGFVDFAGTAPSEKGKLADHDLLLCLHPFSNRGSNLWPALQPDEQHLVLCLQHWCWNLFSSWNTMLRVSWLLYLMVQEIFVLCGHILTFRESTMEPKTRSHTHHFMEGTHSPFCVMSRT
ncbi:hypothetical protein HPB51_028050 [Rhipicephalus microplus]|uniref:Transposable element P transposase-like RNase H domain-containing protein n=1 Tax=Rhipicephalus microplus TaxID=6941 RepID=A0A9J6CYL6_RHIMP|nr:hypothetical protein HPB51_028050 [Rhipicephalus microplus]